MGAAVLSRPFLDHADVSQQCLFTPEIRPEVKHHRRRFHDKRGRSFFPEIEAELHPDGRTRRCNRLSETAEDGPVEVPAQDPFNLGMFRDKGLKLSPSLKLLTVHVSDG